MSQTNSKQNRLASETSPYLQQHASNPVDWYPWSEEALLKAKDEDKPILLSVGYSACHWCHVMAHESFEDEATAALMNKHFVNIKVDREERPDLDKIYQTAQQLLTGRTGGWPLTMFLMPEDHVPFFGGTYFPPTPRYGMPSFPELLERINDFYQNRRNDITEQNAAFLEALAQSSHTAATTEKSLPGMSPVIECINRLEDSFDRQHGGFGTAPKFPHPSNLELLLQCQNLDLPEESKRAAMTMALTTLKKMAAGGIYDQLGGGFCRYSVDAQWLIPHFEKMLYDNGPLLGIYAQADQASDKNPVFHDIARETANWVRQDMQSEEGGYYSSLDADSEGEEGKFYVWDKEQVANLLNEKQFAVFSQRYGLDTGPNFEGKWHLYASKSITEVATEQARELGLVEEELSQAKATLLLTRTQRIWPGRDEKILTSWNAMMIKGMAIAGCLCEEESYLESAESALSFIYDNLWQEQRLLATYKDGKAHLNAYLDDYAFLIEAILALLACRWNDRWLNFAITLADVLLEQFYDQEDGGFFFTSHDHEQLLQRRKDFMDDALPSGNGIAVLALLRLSHLTGNHSYMQAAEKTILAASDILQRAPHACTAMLSGLIELNSPPACVVMRGEREILQPWLQELHKKYGFFVHGYAIPIDSQPSLPGLLAEKHALNGKPTAYVCKGFTCSTQLYDLDTIFATLDSQV